MDVNIFSRHLVPSSIPSTFTTIVHVTNTTSVALNTSEASDNPYHDPKPAINIPMTIILSILLGGPTVISTLLCFFKCWNHRRMRKGKPHYFSGAPEWVFSCNCCSVPKDCDKYGNLQPPVNAGNNNGSGGANVGNNDGTNDGDNGGGETGGGLLGGNALSRPQLNTLGSNNLLPDYRIQDPFPAPAYKSHDDLDVDTGGIGPSRRPSHADSVQNDIPEYEVPKRAVDSFDEPRTKNPEWDALRPKKSKHRDLKPEEDAAYLTTRMELLKIKLERRFPNATTASQRKGLA